MNTNATIAVIVTAAGSSTRMGGPIKKEYLPLGEGTVLSEATKRFLKVLPVKYLVITTPVNDEGRAQEALYKDKSIKKVLANTELTFIEGSSTRQSSIFNALQFLNNKKPQIVLIHDGARPYVTEQIIQDTYSACVEFGASVPGLTPVDTQKMISNGFITEHLTRSNMTAVQTPQGFIFKDLYEAHCKARDENKEYTDDTEIWGKYKGKVKVVPGNEINKKITYQGDYKEKKMTLRCGLGYDMHRLIGGRRLIIGGIEIPYDKGEDGHSDGDALLHAITDALLGASGLGDIGSFFPPEEPQWKDADSGILLKTVWNKIRNEGWSLNNLDCVIKLEKPKFLSYRQEVINNISRILEVNPEQVFVKAKTGEKMDSVGEGKAIEVWCNCIITKY